MVVAAALLVVVELLVEVNLKNMKRKKHKLKAHGVLLTMKYHEKLRYITHGILTKNIKVPVMGY